MNIPNIITKKFLDENPDYFFIFGDNLDRRGTGGAAVLRFHPQSIGFITKKHPTYKDEDFYHPDEYRAVYLQEIALLHTKMAVNPTKKFLISMVGAGLANRFKIFDEVIKPNIKIDLGQLQNAVFLW